MTYPVFFIPGFHGSGETHWQSWARNRLGDSHALENVDWEIPNLTTWTDQVHAQLAALGTPALLVAHSFGALVAAAVAAERPHSVTGMVLVAPANPARFAANGGLQTSGSSATHKPSVADILPESLPATVASVIIASEDDPWLGFSDALEIKERWHSHLVDLGEVGHINVDAGFGPWPGLLVQLQRWRSQRQPEFRLLDRASLLPGRDWTSPLRPLSLHPLSLGCGKASPILPTLKFAY